jgi:hypothetical protein
MQLKLLNVITFVKSQADGINQMLDLLKILLKWCGLLSIWAHTLNLGYLFTFNVTRGKQANSMILS